MARWALVVGCVLAAAACGRRGPPIAGPQRPVPAPAVEAQALDRALDGVEERLIVAQARVRFWEEMRERHESVSAVAVVNLERHAEAMARLDHRPRDERQVVASAKQRRVASRLVPAAEAAR